MFGNLTIRTLFWLSFVITSKKLHSRSCCLDMSEEDRLRCTSAEARTMLECVVSGQSQLALRWRLKERSTGVIIRFFRDVGTFKSEHFFTARTTLGKALCPKASNSLY